jgi:hypothetical protein
VHISLITDAIARMNELTKKGSSDDTIIRWIRDPKLEPMLLIAIHRTPSKDEPSKTFTTLARQAGITSIEGVELDIRKVHIAFPRVVFQKQLLLSMILRVRDALKLSDIDAVIVAKMATRTGWHLARDSSVYGQVVVRIAEDLKQAGISSSLNEVDKVIEIALDYIKPEYLNGLPLLQK